MTLKNSKIPVATSTDPALNFTQQIGILLQPIPNIINQMSQLHITYQVYKSLKKSYFPTDSVISEIDFDSPFDPYLASESALSDWLSPEEDEAWAYLQLEFLDEIYKFQISSNYLKMVNTGYNPTDYFIEDDYELSEESMNALLEFEDDDETPRFSTVKELNKFIDEN